MTTISAQSKSNVCGSGIKLRNISAVKDTAMPRVRDASRAKANTSTPGRAYTNTKALNYSDSISMFKILLATTVFTIGLYLYMVVSTIVATVERKSLEESLRDQVTELSYKESVYSGLLSSVTLASAREAGYIDANNSGFATRQANAVLTLNNE